jgi:uncharacterized protein
MFIGRKKELSKLEELISDDRANIGVIYGRRRVGKSSLINQAFIGHKALFFEGLEDQSKPVQIKNFMLQLFLRTKKKYPRCSTWSEAFNHLYHFIKDDPHHIIFDEFQWMANYRKDIVSELKMMWDQYLSNVENTTLILCGSIASFMVKKVVHSKALYGRTSLTINLRDFQLTDAVQFLQGKGIDELFDAYLYVGGIPLYLELLSRSPSVEIAIKEQAFSEHGFLLEEFEKIFISHFGRNPHYQLILEVLSNAGYGLSRMEIAKKIKLTNGGGLSDLLFDLDQAGFINKIAPPDAAENTKKILYTLYDPYIRFYFALIKPVRKKIRQNTGSDQFANLRQSGVYFNWRGKAFEYLCHRHAVIIAEILGFKGIDYTYGSYFDLKKSSKEKVQIDLVFMRADNVITLCEMKYSFSPVGKDIIVEVEKKVNYMMLKFPNKTIQRVLITKSNPTRDLQFCGYFYKIIKAEMLL